MSEAQRPVLEDDEQPVDPERESAYGISRLMAFSDGVFSIAITLLVLDVPVPVIAAAIPWQFELWGGAYRLTVDLTGLGVTAVTLTGGAEEVVLRLPRPSGTVPVRIFGGAERISMQRPDGTAVRALVRGGVGRLQLDARLVEADGEGTLVESPDYADVADRYDVELAGGAADISISSV